MLEDASQSRCGGGGGGAGLPSVQGSSISLAHPAAHWAPSRPPCSAPLPSLWPLVYPGAKGGEDAGSRPAPSVGGRGVVSGHGGLGWPTVQAQSLQCLCPEARDRLQPVRLEQITATLVIPTGLLGGPPRPSAPAAGQVSRLGSL